MTLWENNLSPYATFVEGTTPASPSAGQQRTFIDSADHKFKRVNSSGTVTTIEGGGGGSGYLGYIQVQDQKTAGTDGGSSTSGSWLTRTLNTKVIDTNSDCTLASNQMTLTAGVYEANISSPAVQCSKFKIRLRNVTDSTTVLVGTSEWTASTAAQAQVRSQILGRFTIAASKALEVQYQVAGALATNGLGINSNFGEVEVYTIVELRRVS